MTLKLAKEGMERLQGMIRKQATELKDDVAKLVKPGVDTAIKTAVQKDGLALSNAARTLSHVKADDSIAKMTFTRAAEQGGLSGGHLPKQIMEDASGNRWMFKTVPTGEEFRALGDKTGGDILGAIGIRTPQVHLTTQVIDGQPRFGTIQQMVQHSGKTLSEDVTQLGQATLDELTQSHVGRWLISDHDGKVANFLLHNSGAVETIDLGQMYRFFPSDSLDRLYQPNAKKPIFNSMWEGYVEGKIDLNFEKGLEQVAKIEALPDQKFIEMLRPYAETRYQQGAAIPGLKSADEFIDSALRRKQNIRTDITHFYDSLAKERGLSGLSEALGAAAKDHADTLAQSGLKPVAKLHPEVAAVWAQSKANAARYKEETLGILTEKFGSRAKAEDKYQALYEQVRKEMFIAANYPNTALTNAIQEGRIRTLYDLPLKDQLNHKGPGYLARRNLTDLRLGIRDDNPLYVTIGGNKKYANDIAKYGDAMVRFKDSDLAGRTLFSDGNHFNFGKKLNAKGQFAKQRFTYFDVPHLTVNRIVKENIGPKEASRLIEGMVFGGIDPRQAAESIKVLKPGSASEALKDAASRRNIPVV